MKNLNNITKALSKRFGKFKVLAMETEADIKLLADLKSDNLSKIELIENENTDIDTQTKEAETFVKAINTLFGFQDN